MGRLRKKGESGEATAFISRTKAIRKLQLTLSDFRRLCIIKGIYPREPKSRKRVGKGNSANRTYYLAKDIKYLAHEPLLDKFRDLKVYLRKLHHAEAKQETSAVARLKDSRPQIKLDHVVRERYPTFVDAVRDLDDALCLLFLFAQMPSDRLKEPRIITQCQKLCNEFLNYVIESRALRKVFVSIKGIYYQADVAGQTVTWITPFQFTQEIPADVDFRIMENFLEFYVTLLKFVNFRLYQSANLQYPPKLNLAKDANGLALSAVVSEAPALLAAEDKGAKPAPQQAARKADVAAAVAAAAAAKDTDGSAPIEEAKDTTTDAASAPAGDVPIDKFPAPLDGGDDTAMDAAAQQEQTHKLQHLFADCWIFLSREVPLLSLEFVIRSLGGHVSWDVAGKERSAAGPFEEADERVTHQIVDRAQPAHLFLGREYVQPQWVYDCVNAGKLLPTKDYRAGALLPPHLSPFVTHQPGDYVPEGADEAAPEAPYRAPIEDAESEEGEQEEEEGEKGAGKGKQGAQAAPEDFEAELAAELRGEEAAPVSLDVLAKKKKNRQNMLKKKERRETKELAKMMMPKRDKRLYQQIMHGKAEKKKEVQNLKRKKQQLAEGAKRTKADKP